MPKTTHHVIGRFSNGMQMINPFEYLRRWVVNGYYHSKVKKNGREVRVDYFHKDLYHYAATFVRPFDVDLDVDHVWCQYLGRVWKGKPFWVLLIKEPDFSFTHFKAWSQMHDAIVCFDNNASITEADLPNRIDAIEFRDEFAFQHSLDKVEEFMYK